MAPLIEGRLPLPETKTTSEISKQFEGHVPGFFWSRYEKEVGSGVRFRVAQFRKDAHKIKEVIHSAWRVKKGGFYFYAMFNDPEAIYQTFILPATRTENVKDLHVLCLVAETQGLGVVGTLSFIFDHVEKTVEIGRAAVAFEMQGKGILSQSIEVVKEILALVDDYALIADTTTLTRSAGSFVHQLGAPGVSFHPSSFTVLSDSFNDWQQRLTQRHGEQVMQALLLKSEETGLGRFATAFHIRIPPKNTIFTPLITDQHRPFVDYSCKVLGINTYRKIQPVFSRKPTVIDKTYTATRIIIDPEANEEPKTFRRKASQSGFETVIVQAPCDRTYTNFHKQMESDAVFLCGVFPNAFGRWYASYVLFSKKRHLQKVRANMTFLKEHQIFSAIYQELISLMLE